MTPNLGDLPIDLTRLLESRMLIQSNSGGGKSHALRRVLEQTAPLVQQIVIDPEGEFASLRERFDYIICAPSGGDAVATPATAAALARAVWESGVSAVIDIYELKAHDRITFVRRFVDALVNAPKKVWHQTLVAIDEVHMFAPQTGQAESLSAVTDLATRGRKRGLSLLGATQRLSKLHKDVAAELLNKLIGRTGLDVDLARAADELGLAGRDTRATLRDLEPGQFFAFGPALSRAVVRTQVGPVVTTHPQAGHRMMTAPPPASNSLLLKLAKLEGLQREATEEVRTVESLQAELAKLRKSLAAAEKARPVAAGITEAEVQRRVREALAQAPAPGLSAPMLRAVANAIAALQAIEVGSGATAAAPVRTPRSAPPREPAAPSAAAGPVHAGVTGPQQRILDAIAWMHSIGQERPNQAAVAFLSGYSGESNGAYKNPRAALRTAGLVDYVDGAIVLTETGRHVANDPGEPPSTEELHRRVLGKLPGPERNILTALLGQYPRAVDNEDLARSVGYSGATNGAYKNPRARLRTFGLIDYTREGVVALPLLFPKGTRV